jgi:DNA-binding CsgD family transcriptional regulator
VTANSSRLLERDEVFSAIERDGRSAASGSGRLLFVEAKAGLGKTSVLAAAGERLASDGLRALKARGAGLERGFAFGIVHQLFGRVVADSPPGRDLFDGVASMAAGLFGLREAGAAADPGEVTPFGMTHALYWVVANLCHSGPVAVLVDDVHEADEASLDFLEFLARRRGELPVLIMIAMRPAEKGQRGRRLDELRWEADTTVELGPLSDGAVASLCRAAYGERWSEKAVTAVARATGGNPFYVGELLRDLGPRWTESGDAQWASRVSPPGIVRSVLSRMAGLPAGSVDLARAYAVLGAGARLTDCAALAAVPAGQAAELADKLAAAGILAQGGAGFAHPIVETAVLADVGEHALRQWHDRAARLLSTRGADPQRVALHLLRCEPADDPERVSTLRTAAQAAARKGTPSATAEYLRRALAESPGTPDRPDILFDLGLAEFALADPAALGHMREAVATTPDHASRAVRSLLSADLHMTAGQAHASMRQLDDVLASAAGGLDEDLTLRLAVKRCWLQLFDPVALLGEPGRGLADLRARCDRPDSLARRELLAYLVVAASNSEPRPGVEALLRQALAPPGITAHIGAASVDALWLLNCLHALEFHDEFDVLAETMRAEASSRGNVLAYASVGLGTARQFLRFGDLRAAESELRTAAEAAELAGWPLLSLAFRSLGGNIMLEQGRVEEAYAALGALPAAGYDGVRTYTDALLVDLRGQLSCERGDTAGALADLRRSGALFERLGFANPGQMNWRGHLARALLRAGQPAAARRAAEEEVADARRLSGPITLAASLHTLAVTISDAEEQMAVLDEARQLAESSRGRLVRAGTLVELGAACRRRGQRVAAREHLQRGFDLATECGAEGLAGRARDELLAAGARPRRASFSGVESLTPSESRVARLAATGHSNAEIAQTLFVTQKTVESHLAAAYRKLGVRSRAELPIFPE